MAPDQCVTHQVGDRLARQLCSVEGLSKDRLSWFRRPDVAAHGYRLVDDIGPAGLQICAGQDALCRGITHLNRRNYEVGLHPVLGNARARSVGDRGRRRAFNDVRSGFEKALQKAGTHDIFFILSLLIFFYLPSVDPGR